MEDKPKPEISEMPSHALIEHASERMEHGAQLKELKQLRDEMVKRGFVHPFAHMAMMPGNIERKEAEDVKKHIDYFMRTAIAKKYTLVRAQALIASDALKKTLTRNGYTDIIAHMPGNGDYIAEIIEHGNGAVRAYRELENYFAGTGHKEERHFIDAEELGMTYRIRGKTREEALAALPKGAMVKNEGKYRKSFPIIRSRMIRKILCASVACYVSDLAEVQFNTGKIKEYNKALLELGIAPFSRLDFAEGMEKEKKALVDKGYMDTDGEIFKTKKEWVDEIYRSREAMNGWAIRSAAAMLFTPMLKYYLLNSRTQREESQIFPTLAPNPTEGQLTVFIRLRQLMGMDAYAIVRRKLQFEGVMDSRALAGGLLSIYATKEIASKITGMKEDEIAKAEAQAKAALGGGKGNEFAKYLDDKGDKGKDSGRAGQAKA